jgi:hypothetical protein
MTVVARTRSGRPVEMEGVIAGVEEGEDAATVDMERDRRGEEEMEAMVGMGHDHRVEGVEEVEGTGRDRREEAGEATRETGNVDNRLGQIS